MFFGEFFEAVVLRDLNDDQESVDPLKAFFAAETGLLLGPNRRAMCGHIAGKQDSQPSTLKELDGQSEGIAKGETREELQTRSGTCWLRIH